MSNLLTGNLLAGGILKATLSPADIEPALTEEQTFTVNGLKLGDQVMVTKPTVQAGIAIAGARVSAANTLAIAFANTTAATTVTPTASEVYTITWLRPEDANNLPTSVV